MENRRKYACDMRYGKAIECGTIIIHSHLVDALLQRAHEPATDHQISSLSLWR
jgi:hypothetical protein